MRIRIAITSINIILIFRLSMCADRASALRETVPMQPCRHKQHIEEVNLAHRIRKNKLRNVVLNGADDLRGHELGFEEIEAQILSRPPPFTAHRAVEHSPH